MARRKRIIWYGDGPDINSGFATVARNLLGGLEKRGWEVAGAFGINSPGQPDKDYNFQICSAQAPYGMGDPDPYGRTRFLQYLDKQKTFDALIALQDSFIMSHGLDFTPNMGGETIREPFIQAATKKARERGARTAAYFPIDATPWGDWFEGYDEPAMSATYTDYGVREVSAVNPKVGNDLVRIYHGCEPEFFGQRKHTRRELKLKWLKGKEDRFVVLYVGANQRRKRLDLIFKSFRYFLDNYCPNATLVMRTQVGNPMFVGWNLQRLTALFEFTPEEIVFVGQDIRREGLRDLYQMADVFFLMGMEGWGLCGTEAMAAKTPCVFGDHSSLAEIAGYGDRALLVPAKKGIDAFDVLSSDHEVRRIAPCPREAARLLNNIRENPDGAAMMAERAFQFCLENTWDIICDIWHERLFNMVA